MSGDRAASRLVVVGLGLIGGSVAKALVPHMDVWGVDTDSLTCRQAEGDGIRIGALSDVVVDGAVVVVAVPVDAMEATFAAIKSCESDVIVTDVGSVKVSVIEAARRHGLRFVGGHPMAGSEQFGYSAANDSLFAGSRWALVCEPNTDLDDWVTVARSAILTGAGVVPVTAVAHDDAVAVVSHLPHVLAAGLAAAAGVDDAQELRLGLAAGSFRDGTRVARSPASFWSSVLAHNADAVSTIVDDLAQDLRVVADALRRRDHAVVEDFFARGVEVRTRFDERTGVPSTIALGAVDAREQLLALGGSGGYVTNIEGPGLQAIAHVRAPRITANATRGA